MPDTKRNLSALQTLLESGFEGNISAQDIRDFLVSVFDDVGYGSGNAVTAAQLKILVDGIVSGVDVVQQITNLRSNALPSPFYRFDGDDYVNLGHLDSLDIGTSDFTYEIVIKIVDWGTNQRLFGQYVDSNNRISLETDVDGRLYRRVVQGGVEVSSTNFVFAPGDDVNHHLAWTVKQNTADEDKIYSDGVLVHTVDSLALANISINADFYIARYSSNYFIGEVSLFRFWNLALSAAELLKYINGSISFKYLSALGDLIGTTYNAGSFVVDRSYRIVTVGTTDFTVIGASSNTIGVEFVATGVGSGTGTALRIGIVVNYSPAGMGHKQWQETELRLHGEVNGATLHNESPVHIEKYVKMGIANIATALTDIHPAGYKLIAIRAKGSAALTAVKIGTSSGGEQIVASVSVGTSPVILTLVSTANDGYSESAADTIYAEHATAGETLDLTFIFQKVEL